jgi:uncharacterized membrane protein
MPSPTLPVCPQCGAEMSEDAVCSHCAAAAPETTDFRERAAAVACYLTPLPAIALLFMKPYNRIPFIRFHAFQSIIIGIAVLALLLIGIVLANVGLTLVWLMFGLLFVVGLLFLWLVLSIKAAQGVRFELPVLGAEAAKRAAR